MLNLFYLILFLVTLLSSLAKQEELKPIKVVETNSSVSFGLIEVSEDKQSPTSGKFFHEQKLAEKKKTTLN